MVFRIGVVRVRHQDEKVEKGAWMRRNTVGGGKVGRGKRPSCSFLGAPGGHSAASIRQDRSTSSMGCARGRRCGGVAGQAPALG